jgi:hypothetical protein
MWVSTRIAARACSGAYPVEKRDGELPNSIPLRGSLPRRNDR